MSTIARRLGKSFRGQYPFRLATTSFILADDYLPNVRQLAPLFDEVELLFFESGPRRPDPQLIDALIRLGEETGVGYDVHLPVDVPLCDPDPFRRRAAADRMSQIIACCLGLAPSTLTLHLPYTPADRGSEARRTWQNWVHESLARMHAEVEIFRYGLSIETLDYPLEWLAPTIEAFDLGVCLDMGHLALAGADPNDAYRRWASRCPIIHLHAAADGRDHLPLDELEPAQALAVMGLLSDFSSTLSLEVFSLDALARSLAWLENHAEGLKGATRRHPTGFMKGGRDACSHS